MAHEAANPNKIIAAVRRGLQVLDSFHSTRTVPAAVPGKVFSPACVRGSEPLAMAVSGSAAAKAQEGRYPLPPISRQPRDYPMLRSGRPTAARFCFLVPLPGAERFDQGRRLPHC